MTHDNTKYVLDPASFHSMRQAQELIDVLEGNLISPRLGNSSVTPELVETFSERVNNATEHGMTRGSEDEGGHGHVRHLPHRRGWGFDVVVSDSGPGIRATLANNSNLHQPETDAEAIGLTVQELVSGTATTTRGIGLWMTVAEMRKPDRKLWVQSGSGLLTMYGTAEPQLRETEYRQGVMVRLAIPA